MEIILWYAPCTIQDLIRGGYIRSPEVARESKSEALIVMNWQIRREWGDLFDLKSLIIKVLVECENDRHQENELLNHLFIIKKGA